MSIDTTPAEKTVVESDDECEDCAELRGGFSCASWYISGRKGFGEGQ